MADNRGILMFAHFLPCPECTNNKNGLVVPVFLCSLRAVERVTLLRFLFGMHPYYPTLDFAFFISE